MSSTLESLLDAPPPLDATTRAEFEDDFQHESAAFLSAARKRAKHGLTHSRLRSVYWRLFLQLLDGKDMSRWTEELRAHRREYDELLRKYNIKLSTHEDAQRHKQHHDLTSTTTNQPNPAIPPNPLTNPIPLSPSPPPSSTTPPLTTPATTTTDLKINNPLSTASASPWAQHFHLTELSGVIQRDLVRTYADSPFYTSDAIQQLMLNVLLVWGKCNPQYEYRQGMNELLAPIVLTVFKDSRASGGWKDGVLGELLDRHWAEHDVWALFNKLMLVMAPFFAKIDSNNSSDTTSKPYLRPRAQDTNDLLFPAPPVPTNQSPILLKCHHIHHTLLAQHDPLLYKHLNSQDVQPQLYGLRWYRLLFAREFHVIDVCTVWDVLFSQEDTASSGGSSGGGSGRRGSGMGISGGGFIMADYFVVAMLFYVRGQLLQGDNTACLRRLLKFPPVEDMRALIDRALFFTAPQQSQRGTAASGGGAGGVDLPSIQQDHILTQQFIADYGSELEASYLSYDDPLGPLKRTGQAKAAKLADGINKLRNKASGSQHKTMPVAGTVPIVTMSAPLQHSSSASSLTHPPTPVSTAASSISSSSPSSSATSLLSPRPVSVTSTTALNSLQPSPYTVPYLTALQHDMGDKLHHVIHTLTAEYGRVHRARATPHSADKNNSARVEAAGVKVGDELQAQEREVVREEKQSKDGLNVSVEMDDANGMNGHTLLSLLGPPPPYTADSSSVASSAANFDLQMLSSSLAELKHIADVLLGRLSYTSHNVSSAAYLQTDLDTPSRPHSAGGVRDTAGSAQSPTASQVFFAPATVDDPKARLAQLLSEKEAKELQQLSSTTNSSHHSSDLTSSQPSPHYKPTLPFPTVKRNSLSVIPQSRTAAFLNDPATNSPSSAPIRASSGLPPPPVLSVSTSPPSLFDSSGSGSGGVVGNGGNNSARALLSSLLGGEKRSVFED